MLDLIGGQSPCEYGHFTARHLYCFHQRRMHDTVAAVVGDVAAYERAVHTNLATGDVILPHLLPGHMLAGLLVKVGACLVLVLADGGEELVIGTLCGNTVLKAHQPHGLTDEDVEAKGLEHLLVAVAAALLVDSHGAQKAHRGTGATVAFAIKRAEYLLGNLAVHVMIELVVGSLRVVEITLRPRGKMGNLEHIWLIGLLLLERHNSFLNCDAKVQLFKETGKSQTSYV